MSPDEYGSNYQEHFLEQYKLYVEMADRVSQLRDQSNRFYIALLSGLAAVLAVAVDTRVFAEAHAIVFLVAGIVGLTMCGVWLINVRSYRQLNSGKFQVIHEMERHLPIPVYGKEWEILRPEEGTKNYLQLTRVEQFIPGIVAIPYLLLAGYSLYKLIYG